MKRFSPPSFRWTLAALTLVLMLALPWAVFADQVVNTIDTTVDPDLEIVTITPGGSASVGFYILVQKDVPPGDLEGCNATGADRATVTLSVPSGVTASPSSVTLKGCGLGTAESVSFSSSTPGSYTISVLSVTGGKSGSLWDTTPAAFTLIVNPVPPSDTTPPVIVPTVSPAPNANGWNNTNITVSWNVSDPESGIASSSGCGTTTLTTETAGTTLTCSATNGAGLSNSASVTVKIDKTKPVITGSPTPPANVHGWNNTDVEVSFSCADTGTVQSGIDTNTVAGATLTSEGENQEVTNTGSCTDKAGNIADSATVSGINIDKTPPTFGACPAGGPFLLNSGLQSVGPISVDAAISGLSEGLSTLSGSVDTSSIGTRIVTFTAVDNADNTETKHCGYSVIYNWNGFFRPVDNLPTLNVAKAGSAIPVKFSLSGNQGLNIFPTGYPLSRKIACDTTALLDAIEVTVTAAGASSLSYDASTDQYVYVWKTDKLWAGTCRQLVVWLNDGMEYQANFHFTR